VALAMLPVAQDFKKVLIVEPAVADSITGDKWNRYVFRTGRNSSQDAISNALAIGKPGMVVATLAQDYAFGRDGVAAFREALAGPAPSWCTRNMHRRPPPTSPPRCSAFSTRSARRRAQGALGDLGRRQSVPGDQGAQPGAARHRGLDRRQHPPRARRLQGVPRASRARPITTSRYQEPRK